MSQLVQKILKEAKANPTSLVKLDEVTPRQQEKINATRLKKYTKAVGLLNKIVLVFDKARAKNPRQLKPYKGEKFDIWPRAEHLNSPAYANSTNVGFDFKYVKPGMSNESDGRITVAFDGPNAGKTFFNGKEITSKADIIAILPKKISAKQSKAYDLLDVIKRDFKYFNPGGGSARYYDEDDQGFGQDGLTLSRDFRHLGRWIDDMEDGQSDYEDNDQRIWAPGEYKKYAKVFQDWAKTKPWYKKVKLGLETSEKDWCSFTITIK